MVQMLGINVDKKTEIHLSCYRSDLKMCLPTECFIQKSKILNTKIKMLIYHAFIDRKLNYCPLIWINRYKTDMKYIENVQK